MNLKNDFAALKIILKNWPRSIAVILLTIVFTYLYFILTGVYVTQYHAFNISVSAFNIIMLILISGLSSLLIVTYTYAIKEEPLSFTGILGSIFTFFTTACGCQSFWLLSLGLTVPTLSFFRQITDYIQIASVILLLISLHVNLNRISSCNLK